MTDTDLQKQVDKIQEHLNRIGGKQMDIIEFLNTVLNDKSTLLNTHSDALSKISKT